VGASARPHQLQAQGGEGLLLGLKTRQGHLSVRHRHRADLQLRRGSSEREPLEDGEPQGCGLGCWQLLQSRPGEGGLTGSGGIEAAVAEWAGDAAERQ